LFSSLKKTIPLFYQISLL